MITLGLTGTVDRIEGDDAYCLIIDNAGMRGTATFAAGAMAEAGIGVGDDFQFIYGTGQLERLATCPDSGPPAPPAPVGSCD